MKLEVNLNVMSNGVLDKIEGMCDYWAHMLSQTKPINPINEVFDWALPTEVLLHVEQTAPGVEIDAIGDYSIYAMFPLLEIDNIKNGDGKGITFLAFINGRLCILPNNSIGWIQIESIQANVGGDNKAALLHITEIRNRLMSLDITKRHQPDVILNLCDITNALDDRQITRNGFSSCYADVFAVLDSLKTSGEVDIPLISSDSKVGVLKGQSVKAEILSDTVGNCSMITIDLPAGVGMFMNNSETSFLLQVLEKHPINGSVRSRTMSRWSGTLGGLQFNWRCPTTATLTFSM